MIGEFHNPETHLIPVSVFRGIKDKNINIFGDDYKTKDLVNIEKEIDVDVHKLKEYEFLL